MCGLFQDGTSASTECGFFVDPTIPQEYNLLRGLSNDFVQNLVCLQFLSCSKICAPGLQTFIRRRFP